MSTHKDEKTGTWYVMVRYYNWKGEKKQKCKRGFTTRREAQEWERNFTPNPRIFKAMNIHMQSILKELQRLSQGENPRDELLEDIALITKMMNDMKEETK